MRLTLGEVLAVLTEPEHSGAGESDLPPLAGIASMEKAREGDLAFLGNPKYRSQVSESQATLILLPRDFEGEPAPGRAYIRVDNPSHALARVCRLLEDKLFPPPSPGVHPAACVEAGAQVAPSASVGPFCHLGPAVRVGENARIDSHVHLGSEVSVGEDCRLFPGVKVLARCEIGPRTTLNAGVVIGSEGYGFDQVEGAHEKIPHLGKVVIEEDVEIGANTCIDRSRFDETRIGAGSKIDNLVQIGHNVTIGKRCLVVAQVGISGSVVFEDDVVVGGQAGFAGHLTVGKGAKIAGQAGITKNVEPGAFLKGNPALPFPLAQRIAVLQRKLPDLFKRFAELETNT